ncbi:hypothetical protein [uncultured Shimia sp.]|uniref:hypothetical protein n=1 Tax=uncultured Shimia sp. TaxID=573152 RepID=UPI0026212EC8|nr:hypothetical protein [uncultured Shimia sp.]
MQLKALATVTALVCSTSVAVAALPTDPTPATPSQPMSYETYDVATTNGMDRRKGRRDTRQDCRQDNGAVGKDKRDCKQDGRSGCPPPRRRNDLVAGSKDCNARPTHLSGAYLGRHRTFRA